MGDFLKEIKMYVEKHVNKKIIKLYTSEGQWKKSELINEDKAISQEDIHKYSQYLTSTITTYSEGAAKMYEEGRNNYI